MKHTSEPRPKHETVAASGDWSFQHEVSQETPITLSAEQESADLFRNLYIFEMANNHQGSLEHGLKIVRAMSRIARSRQIRSGVKLQYRELDSFMHPSRRIT